MLGEIVGYIASLLVFATFYVKTMITLRLIAIASNFGFIAFGYIEGLPSVFVLHSCLLPLNLVRLRQFNRLMEKARSSVQGEISLDALLPFMTPQRFKAGDVLFRKGDRSREMYYISEGQVRLVELDKTLGARETLGEIGLFAPDNERTVTAVCETDGELLRMPEEKFLQLYNQSPRFGFQISRIVTRRLIENYEKLLLASHAEGTAKGSESKSGHMADKIEQLDEQRQDTAPEPRHRWMSTRSSRILISLACFLAFLAILALGWKATPYVHSVLVRDATVTTWSNLATAPIDGTITFAEVRLHETVGTDGQLAVVENEHLTRRALDEARIKVKFAKLRVDELADFLEEIKSIDSDRGDIQALYADSFRDQVDTRIISLESEIATLSEELVLIRKIAERKTKLAERSALSQNEADEANLRVSDLEVELAGLRSDLRFARVRQDAAKDGVFVRGDGDYPDWVVDSRIDLQMQKNQANKDLQEAQAQLEVATIGLAAAEEDFRRLSMAPVTAPPGSIFWSRHVATGSTVQAGDPVAEWLDCSVLLIDVPLPDIELPLIEPGMEADIILDGESDVRTGRVLLARGSAVALDSIDLAAIARGRDPDEAQVIIDISHAQDSFKNCPVGRAAFVDFPQIGLLDIVLA